ncbi:MAG: hypothetical protein ABJM06_10375 [Gilvibacter sp.]
MKNIISLLLLFVGLPLMAQMNVVSVNAYVLDGITQHPIEFVNLNVVDRDLGTVTATDGTFHLEFIEDQIGAQDIIKITALGYATKEMRIDRFFNLMENNNILYLNPYNQDISDETLANSAKTNVAKRGITGKVSSAQGPVQGAIVGVKGSYKRVITDVNGQFSIDAMPGQTLEIESLTTLPKEIAAQNNMNIALEVDGELLEQVNLKSEKKTFLSDRKFETAYGKKEFNRIGFRVTQINEESINNGYTSFEQLFYQLPIANFNMGSSITLNNGRATVVDDVIYAPGNIIPYIDIQNVYSVTVIPGVAGAVKYGTLGRNGVIIIRTKTYAASQGDYKPEAEEQKALVTGNNYNEQLPLASAMPAPNYIASLRQASSFDQAKKLYKQQQQSADSKGISFYVNASEYFERWSKEYSASVAMNILEVAPKNTKALKTLAYRLEALGDLEGAKSVYQRLAILAPNDAQSFRDLAYIYKETGEYTKAFALYKRILANNTEGVNFSGIQAVAEAELRHLIANHKDKVYYKDLPNSLLQVSYKKDVRVVFEWNDPLAEFDLQFVSPSKKYFTYKNTKFDNFETMQQQLAQGYAIQEFEIDDSPMGGWLVNIQSLAVNASEINPTYLKYTVYKNFGTKKETKEVHVINVSAQQKKVTLASLDR